MCDNIFHSFICSALKLDQHWQKASGYNKYRHHGSWTPSLILCVSNVTRHRRLHSRHCFFFVQRKKNPNISGVSTRKTPFNTTVTVLAYFSAKTEIPLNTNPPLKPVSTTAALLCALRAIVSDVSRYIDRWLSLTIACNAQRSRSGNRPLEIWQNNMSCRGSDLGRVTAA